MLYATGVEPASLAEAATSIHCKSGVLPFKYIGLLVGTSMSRCGVWQPLIDKFQRKLSSWKASTLSVAGRMVLCKSVLGSLDTYFFSLYKVSEAVLSKLESLGSIFFLEVF